MEETKKDKKKCFVITPIGEDNSSIRRHIDGILNAAIRPALKDEYEVIAAHEINATGSINNQVIVEIYESELVIANLTELNPNVMYELAIRHCLKKPVIMIMEKGNGRLPFDVSNERTIFYINDSQGVIELKERLINAVKDIDENKTTNPVYDALTSYKQDEAILKNIEVKDVKNADTFKIILNKLNKLESNLVERDFNVINKNISDSKKARSLICMRLAYRDNTEYDKVDLCAQKVILYVKELLPIDNVDLTIENGIIRILFLANALIDKFENTYINELEYIIERLSDEFNFIIPEKSKFIIKTVGSRKREFYE